MMIADVWSEAVQDFTRVNLGKITEHGGPDFTLTIHGEAYKFYRNTQQQLPVAPLRLKETE